MNKRQFQHALYELAAQAVPSELDLWPAIRARLAPRPHRTLGMRLLPSTHLSWVGSFLAILLAFSVMAYVTVPSERAQVGEFLNALFYEMPAPNGSSGFAISDFTEFEPLNPTYLPKGKWQSMLGGRDEAGITYLVLQYYKDEQFIYIAQSKAESDKSLPAGQPVSVNGQPATLISDLSGTVEGGPTYTNAKQLTWYVGEVKVELLSNLSEEEILRISESLRPADSTEMEVPPTPQAPRPFNTPPAP